MHSGHTFINLNFWSSCKSGDFLVAGAIVLSLPLLCVTFVNVTQPFSVPNSRQSDNFCYSHRMDICKKIAFMDFFKPRPETHCLRILHKFEYVQFGNNCYSNNLLFDFTRSMFYCLFNSFLEQLMFANSSKTLNERHEQ